MGEIDQLKLVVESTKYSEIDLVLAHEVDPRELVLDYPDRALIRQEERRFKEFRTVRFLAPPH